MATPAWHSSGTPAYSANSVANPTSIGPLTCSRSVGDLLLLICCSRSNTATVATPTGYSLVTGFPIRSATTSGGTIYLFSRIATNTTADQATPVWSGVTTGTSGDSCSAQLVSWSNAIATRDGIATPTDVAATTSWTMPATTTGSPNSLVVGLSLKISDTAQTTTITNFTERGDNATQTGTGHIVQFSDLVVAAAGSSGTGTVTPSNTTSSRVLAVSVGFRAAPTTVAVTAATEADVAVAASFTKPIHITTSVAAETGTAQARSFTKPLHITTTAAAETDAAAARSFTKPLHKTATPAAETDAAVTVSFTKPIRKATTPAAETDTAQSLVFTKPIHKALGVAAETDSAVAPSYVKPMRFAVDAAIETDAASAISFTKPIHQDLTPATEADVALALQAAKVITATSATESDTVQAESYVVPIHKDLVPSIEADVAQSIGVRKLVRTGAASESETALAPAAVKRATVSPAVEIEVTQTVTVTVGAETAPTEPVEGHSAQDVPGRFSTGGGQGTSTGNAGGINDSIGRLVRAGKGTVT